MSPKKINRAIAIFSMATIFTGNVGLPVLAKIPEQRTFKTEQKLKIANHDLTRPSVYLDELWGIQWSVSGFVHRSILRIKGYSGNSITTYYNPDTKSKECVIQQLEVYDSSEGMIIFGYTPLDCTTKQRHPTYSADNFLIRIDNGLEAFVKDDQGVTARVTITNLSR
jgi:hypothetical protein